MKGTHIMSGTRALGVEVPDDYDVTITSTTDTEKSVRAAAGLEAADGDEAADDDDTDPDDGDETADEDEDADGEGDDADDDDEEADGEDDGEEEPARAPRRDAKGYEGPVKGEDSEDRIARIERNVKRIEQLNTKVANKDQHIENLKAENARLRAGKSAGQDGEEPGTRRETAAAEAPKFNYPSFDEWSELKANEGRSLEEYSDERQDARTAFKDGLTAVQTARERAAAATNAVVSANKARVEEMRELHEDYDDVLATSRAPMTNTMQLTMMQRPYGAAVAYYCSSTPEGLKEAKRIAKLPPLEQVEELGILGRSKAVRALMPKSANGQAPAKEPDPAARRRKAKAPVEDADEIDEILASDDDDEDEQPPARRSRQRTSRAPRPLQQVAGGARRSRELAELPTDEYIARMDGEDVKRGKRR